jgi:hypothetical protein
MKFCAVLCAVTTLKAEDFVVEAVLLSVLTGWECQLELRERGERQRLTGRTREKTMDDLGALKTTEGRQGSGFRSTVHYDCW